jgi:hypothetical protein
MELMYLGHCTTLYVNKLFIWWNVLLKSCMAFHDA